MNNKLIMLVEDKGPVREVTSQMLKIGGFNTESFPDATCALGKLKEFYDKLTSPELNKDRNFNPYHLILSDFTMPGMKGIEFAERANNLFPTIPIILMTGYLPDIKTPNCIKEVLAKPINLDYFHRTLNKYIG